MKRLAALLTIISIALVFGGCATVKTMPTHQGGKLFPTEKTPMDGFFLRGNLAYTKEHLKVNYYADNKATSTSNLVVQYLNEGQDGIELKTTCCLADMMGRCFSEEGSVKQHNVHLLPYSAYTIRERASKAAQGGTHLVCDHGETFTGLWNNKELNIRK
ncbi:MAG: hypothetical protein V1661_00400 [bacterium]